MNNRERVLAYLQSIYPAEATNAQIRDATDINPHQQVFQITKKLMNDKQINGHRINHEWIFSAKGPGEPMSKHSKPEIVLPGSKMTHRRFEAFARSILSQRYGVQLQPKQIPGVPKTFDFVSADHQVVGDAKYYTLVGGKRRPPAKFSTIAEHVWLLEKIPATEKLLVFGNDRRVPVLWLEKHRHLCAGIKFFFLSNNGELQEL